MPGYEGWVDNTDPVGAFDPWGNFYSLVLAYQFYYDKTGGHKANDGWVEDRGADRLLRHRPQRAVDVPEELVVVGECVHRADHAVLDDVAVGAPHEHVRIADLDDLVVAFDRCRVGDRAGAVGHPADAQLVVAVVGVVVPIAERDRAEDPVLLQRAEVDVDGLGDGQGRIRRDLDVGVERGDRPALVGPRCGGREGDQPEGDEDGQGGSGTHRQPVYCQFQ